MMLKQLSLLLVLVQVWTDSHLTVTALIASNPLRGYHGAPIIDPYDSILIDVDSTKVIECKAKKAITWVSEIITNNPDNVKVTHFLHENSSNNLLLFTDEQNLYRSNLEISNASVALVGNFYCVFNDSVHEISNNYDYEQEIIDYEASSIYVFVNDPNNLLYDHGSHLIIGKQYEPFVIPCKPNSPKTRVELLKENREVISNETYNERTGYKLVINIDVDSCIFKCVGHFYDKIEELEISIILERKYDPKLGYTVSFSDIEDSGFFECQLADDPEIYVQFHVIVNEQPLSVYIKKPIITSESQFHALNGDILHITCHAEMDSDVPYNIYFTLPSGKVVNESNEFVTLSQLRHEEGNRRKSHRNLTIENSNSSRDEGDYQCTVKDGYENSNTELATILFIDEPIMKWDVPQQNITTTKPNRKRVQFLVGYTAHPPPTFEMYNNHDELIARGNDVLNREKYDITISKDQVKFSVKFPGIGDSGEYSLVAQTDGKNYTQKLFLFISEKPTCTMESVYIMAGEQANMICECLAYPKAAMSWSFQACSSISSWPDCGWRNDRLRAEKYQMIDIDVDDVDETSADSEQKTDIAQVMSIRFTPDRPGRVTCKASNTLGNDRVSAHAKIGDLQEPFMITGLKDDHEIATGDFVELECGAIIYNYTNSIQWLKDGNIIESEDGIEVQDTSTEYSWRKKMIFHKISSEHDGEYNCEVNVKESDELKTLLATIRVHDAVAPSIITNFNQSTITKPFGEMLTLECYTNGLPIPILTWKKDGEIFEIDENDTRIALNGMRLDFTVLKPEDSGDYECIAQNRIATVSKSVEIVITAPSKPVNKAIIIGVITIILVLVLLLFYLCLKVRIKKRQIAMLKAAGLVNFEEGQVESIDPDVNIDEQADLLPYDKKFEFPREKLKLGKQLGAGAFGIVVKATAEGIVHYEDESTVAVKMVKKQTDNEVMKALVSELKIMIHMGQHLNVVNLLGAVTKNIAKRELMVIVEYCRFGNLQSFLVKHRPYFIDQVRNDRIDPMIMKNEMRWSNNSAYNSFNSQGLKYISVTFANDKVMPKEHSYININGNRYINFSAGNQYTPPQHVGLSTNPGTHVNTQGYVRHSGFHQIDSCNTEATVVSNMETLSGEESALLTNNSEQPLWRSNYTTDYKGPARSVCTSDLVCWAFQVARGMDYLASKKVLHGDLAARNILLCDDNIVKICDFGLARSMYKNDNYKKKGEAPLPFKWLSIEAISDHLFSTYSDVWAFGVVLWELFTLGKVPYPGMEANEELFYKLRDGYRMEKPKYATQELYDIMLNCWNKNPESRPLFNQLERKLSSFMMDSVKDHYLDLNEPYMEANTKHYKSGVRDYLTQLSVPDGEAPLPPLAQEETFNVDNSTTEVAPSTPDYLSMSPKSGVVKYNMQKAAEYLRPESPTIAKNLDTSPKNKKNTNKKPEIPEEIPMLSAHNQNGLPVNDSDEEPMNTAYTDMNRSRRNSSGRKKRQAPQPPVAQQQASSEPEYKNVFVSSENYVNVPAISKNASVANPAYITFQSINERA